MFSTKYLTIYIAVALICAAAFAAEDTPDKESAPIGLLLQKRDFADGQINMMVQNITPGAKGVVVDVDGKRALQIIVPFALRQNRMQIQFFLDRNSISLNNGPYYMVSFLYRDGVPNGLNINPELLPYWTGNELKGGVAKQICKVTDEPDAEGWCRMQYLFQFDNKEWDGYLLQFRLLLFRDNAVPDTTYEGFLRNLEIRQWSDEIGNSFKARNSKP